MMRKTNQKGFTLVELLVVIAIIGLLATLAVVSLNNARKKARDAKRKSDLNAIATAMEYYKVEDPSNLYPDHATTDCTGVENGRVGEKDNAALNKVCSGTPIQKNANEVFLQAIPAAPTTPAGDQYTYEEDVSSTEGYCLQADLEVSGNNFLCVNGSCYESTKCCEENGLVSSSDC